MQWHSRPLLCKGLSRDAGFFEKRFGGPEPSDIEPADPVAFLEELENWADVLNNEPEALRLLATFSVEATGGTFQGRRIDDAITSDPVLDHPEPSP